MVVYKVKGNRDAFRRGDEVDHYYSEVGFYSVWTGPASDESVTVVDEEEIPIYSRFLGGILTEQQMQELLAPLDLDRIIKTMQKLHNSQKENVVPKLKDPSTAVRILGDVQSLLEAWEKDRSSVMTSAKFVYMIYTFDIIQNIWKDWRSQRV